MKEEGAGCTKRQSRRAWSLDNLNPVMTVPDGETHLLVYLEFAQVQRWIRTRP